MGRILLDGKLPQEASGLQPRSDREQPPVWPSLGNPEHSTVLGKGQESALLSCSRNQCMHCTWSINDATAVHRAWSCVLCALTQVSSIWSHLSNFARQRGYFGVQGKGYWRICPQHLLPSVLIMQVPDAAVYNSVSDAITQTHFLLKYHSPNWISTMTAPVLAWTTLKMSNRQRQLWGYTVSGTTEPPTVAKPFMFAYWYNKIPHL